LNFSKHFSAAVRYLTPALSIADKVSERDAELFKFAEEVGFFGWPRRTTLTALSKKLDIPKSTLYYRFRTVQKKIAEALS
jgi:predicted DNA binding protein